jgi:hypothetical protein
MKFTCLCCGKEAKYSLKLFRGDEEDGSPRWYLPNQSRNMVPELLEQVWFCHPCMREIEDNFRATVSGLTKRALDEGYSPALKVSTAPEWKSSE